MISVLTTVKVAILDSEDKLLFSDYQRHFANIQETLAELLTKAYDKLGPTASSITGSGGLTLAKHLDIPFVQEVVAVATSLAKTTRLRQMLRLSLAVRMLKSSTLPAVSISV